MKRKDGDKRIDVKELKNFDFIDLTQKNKLNNSIYLAI